jgi:hypothetical protein
MSKSKAKTKPVPIPSVLKDAALARLDDEVGRMTLPVLYECVVPTYDGTKLTRPAGKITITVEGAHWRVQLDLPYECLTCRLASSSLAECLSDLNAYLASGKAIFSPGWSRSKKALPTLDAAVE